MSNKKELSHIDDRGLPGMVDVSDKSVTHRFASASGEILIDEDIMARLSEGGFNTKKGSIIQTAIIAATMAVKKTYDTIPLCHQIPIASCKMHIDPQKNGFKINCQVKTNSQTGVEMEALHGVSIAALTIYDMCKALSHDMKISNISLHEKKGGKNDYQRQAS